MTNSIQPQRNQLQPQELNPRNVQDLEPEDLAASFSGTIKRVPLSIGYKLSLVAVAFVMLLLPLIYVALICLVTAGAAWYAVAGLGLFQDAPKGRGGFALVLLYVGPLVIAAITVIFMIKPFFARLPKAGKPLSLDPQLQPQLFDFVKRICQSVGAPVPKRIDLDSEVNASASFRSGWLSLIQSNDLVLTIGMPLVKGLTVRELGGILAHEFGHFSQGLGMRLTYVIRSINMWFARVVYQRDRADEWLTNTAQSVDFRIGIVLYLAMIVVWFTRKILWALMMLGHIVSSLLMRQMEYDADSYEIQLAGTECFTDTFAKLRRLGLAYQQAIAECQQFYVDGKLVDNLPELVSINCNLLPDELIKAMNARSDAEKGHWFDTHPTDQERIAAARRMNSPGIFKLHAPAESLFNSAAQLSKDVTKGFFADVFGKEFKESMLASVEQLTSFKQSAKEAEDARVRMFSEAFNNPRVMHLGLPTDRQQSLDTSLMQIQRARQRMDAGKSQYEQTSKQFEEVDSRWLDCHRASALLACSIKLKPDEWKNFPVQSQAEIDALTQTSQMELATLHDQLLSFEQAFAQRVDGALQWLFGVRRMDPEHECVPLIGQAQSVLQCLSACDQVHRQMQDMRNDFISVFSIVASAGGNLNDKHRKRMQFHMDRLKAIVPQVSQNFSDVNYPFEHAEGTLTMSRYLAPQADKIQELSDVLEVCNGMLQNIQVVYFRSIGTLSSVIEKVESSASELVPIGEELVESEPEVPEVTAFVEAPSENRKSVEPPVLASASEIPETPRIEIGSISPAVKPTVKENVPRNNSKWSKLTLAASLLLVVCGGVGWGAYSLTRTKRVSPQIAAIDRNIASNAQRQASVLPHREFEVNVPAEFSSIRTTLRKSLYRFEKFPLEYKFKLSSSKQGDKPFIEGTLTLLGFNENQDTTPAQEEGVGVVVDSGGLIVTNARFAEIGVDVEASQTDWEVPAKVLAVDSTNGLALLSVPRGFRGSPTLSNQSLTPSLGAKVISINDSGSARSDELSVVEAPVDSRVGESLSSKSLSRGFYLGAKLPLKTIGSAVMVNDELIGVTTREWLDGSSASAHTTSLVPVSAIETMLERCQLTRQTELDAANLTREVSTDAYVVRVRSRPPAGSNYRLKFRSQYEMNLGRLREQRNMTSELSVLSNGEIKFIASQEGALPFNLGSFPAIFFEHLDSACESNWRFVQEDRIELTSPAKVAKHQAIETITYQLAESTETTKTYRRDYNLVTIGGNEPALHLFGTGKFVFDIASGAPESLDVDLTYKIPGKNPVDLKLSYERQ